MGEFYVEPDAIMASDAARYVPIAISKVAAWIPDEDELFMEIPVEYRGRFAAMVRQWGHLVGAMVPADGRTD